MTAHTTSDLPVIWITGASSGIGKAFAQQYAKDGAHLILSSRRVDELEKIKSELTSFPNGDILVMPLDLSAGDVSLQKKTEEAWAWKNKVDVLVNNGGISQRSLFLETDMQTIRRLLEVNLFGTLALSRFILPSMVNKGSGHIIVTSSVAGKFGTKYRSGYAASKHAIQGAFDSIRQEMYEHNIDITLVCPGPIKTAITQNSLTGDGKAFGKMGDLHTHAMNPNEMLRQIWPKIKARKEEIVVSGPKERLALLLKRAAPGILNHILKQSKVV
ncbi:MAG: short chain dehydrogenase [Balneola sp.]|nr:short chain dehydrogenase [Balneola sp.]|tara:strand:+ start:2404 stop:3219 length:816 start_codon:yes stop_codon:yes gene_type:complete